MELQELANRLRRSEVFSGKRSIDFVRSAFGDAFASSGIANGDDTAAIPDGSGGYLLLAAEGILPGLCAENPELAGRSAVLANVNDVYAMGGRPLAMVDVIGAPQDDILKRMCQGMRDNAKRFNVPIVGGHVQATADEPSLALAIMGRAKKLITSFDAKPGDALVLVTNMDGRWLEKSNYWNCTLPRHDANLVGNLELLPEAAEAGLTCAGKDVSMAGIAGTLVMLAECSGVGAYIDTDSVPVPEGYDREVWLEPFLRAFFSYGFLLSAREEKLPELVRPFLARGLYAARIGGFRDGSQVMLQQGGRSALLQDWGKQPFIGDVLSLLPVPPHRPLFVTGSGMLALDMIPSLPWDAQIECVDLSPFQKTYLEKLCETVRGAKTSRELREWLKSAILPELNAFYARRGSHYSFENVISAMRSFFRVRFFFDNEHLARVRERLDRVHGVTGDMVARVGQGGYDFVHLSNIVDYLTPVSLGELFSGAARYGAPLFFIQTTACPSADALEHAWKSAGYEPCPENRALCEKNLALGTLHSMKPWMRSGRVCLLFPRGVQS